MVNLWYEEQVKTVLKYNRNRRKKLPRNFLFFSVIAIKYKTSVVETKQNLFHSFNWRREVLSIVNNVSWEILGYKCVVMIYCGSLFSRFLEKKLETHIFPS